MLYCATAPAEYAIEFGHDFFALAWAQKNVVVHRQATLATDVHMGMVGAEAVECHGS